MVNNLGVCKPLVLFLLLAALLGACNNAGNVPFPADASEYAQPVSRPLKLGEPFSLQWKVVNENVSYSAPQRLDMDKIPAKPFDIGVAVPLKKPVEVKSFDLNNLRDTTFNMESLPTQKFRFKTRLLLPPTVVKADWPQSKLDASRGIMEVGPAIGLPSVGRWVLEDRSGLVWIGTNNGICTYNGTNVEIYGKQQGLLDLIVEVLYEDRQGRIWIGTRSGDVYVLDRNAGVILQLVSNVQHGAVYGILEDTDGDFWISQNRGGVMLLNLKNQTVKLFTRKEGLADNTNFYILQDKQGLIWISSLNGVSIVDKRKKTNKHLHSKNGLADNVVFCLSFDADDNIWIGSSGGAELLNRKEKTISLLSTEQGLTDFKTISCIYEDRSGKIWMGASSGTAFSFDKRQNLLEKFAVAVPVNLYTIYEDRQHQIWITGDIGTYKLNPGQGRPGNFTTANGLGSSQVWSTVQRNNGQTWIGTVDGIDVYDSATRSIRHIDIQNGLHYRGTIYLAMKSDDEILARSQGHSEINVINTKAKTIQHINTGLEKTRADILLPIGKDHYLIGARDGSFFELRGKQLRQATNLVSLKDSRILNIVPDDEQYWISGSKGGVCLVNLRNSTAKLLTSEQGLVSDKVNSIFKNSEGNILIGTAAGIDWVDEKNKTITTLSAKDGLGDSEIWSLNEFKGVIYAGTTAGLSIMMRTPAPEGGKWKVYALARAQGLSKLDFAVNSGSFTKAGQFWAGVENSIMTIIDQPKFDSSPPMVQITGIKVLDKPQRFLNKSKIKERPDQLDTLWHPEGNLFFANAQRALDSAWTVQPKVTWDSTDQHHLPVNLQLPYDQNYFSFTFTGNDLANPDKVRYRYLLQGIDKNWSPISSDPFSENYRDLPAGKYTFKVAARSMNGGWSAPAAFNFIINPPWWQSWWAYGGYALVFIAAIRAYTSYRSKALKAQNQLLEEKVAARTNALQKSLNELQETQKQLIQSEKMASLGELTAGIAHEIQNPLNFVNNFSEVNTELTDELLLELEGGKVGDALSIARNIKENELKISHHGKRADSIVKGMLQHARTSTSQKEPTDINALCEEYLRLAYHGLRAKDKTFNASTKTEFDPAIDKAAVIRQDLGRVILNLITNAFYVVTEKKKLHQVNYEPTVVVGTKRLDEKVLISIKDNGSGIPEKTLGKIFQPFFTTKPSGQGTGLGLSISYDIVKAHGGEIKVETREGEGTEFIIILPNT